MSRKKREAWAENGLEDWGSYMTAKKAKLEDQFQEQAENEFKNSSDIFKGISIFVNGYTTPNTDELKRLMMENGGTFHHYQSKSTTHMIASNLPYAKIIQYRKSKNPLPICKPEWIIDSIRAAQVLDWRPYLLFSNATVTQPQLQFSSVDKSTIKNNSNDVINLNKSKEILPGPSEDSPAGDSKQNISEQSKELTKDPNPPSTSSKNIQNSSLNLPQNNHQAMCSKDAEFISEFYNNSRLHHIATMGATFKEYVNELRLKNTGSFPGLNRLKELAKNKINKNNDTDSDEDLFASETSDDNSSQQETVIMHIDMDCFFVSVGLRNRPDLIGKPVAVTHSKGNKQKNSINDDDNYFGSMSEIASCSYEARKAGLKNGMFLGQALKLCPNLKMIKYDFEGYKEVSYCLYNTIASYTLDIEAVSCDEMYADITKILIDCNLTTNEFAKLIRDEIKGKTGCPVSTGFGCNKLQARLATKKAKPDGYYYLKNQNVHVFMRKINVRDIPGVGSSTMYQLKKLNVETCEDLQNISMTILQKEFGKKTGEMLYNTCRGIDNGKLNIEHVRKSVSAEVNYGIRFESDNDAKDFLTKLSKEVCGRLRKVNSKGRCLTLKLMVRAKNAPIDPAKFMGHGMCDNLTKSKNFMTPVDDENIITRDVLGLWEQMQQDAIEIRGIGIQISRLENFKIHNANSNMMKFISRGTFKDTGKINAIKNNTSIDDVNKKNTEDKKLVLNNNNNNINQQNNISKLLNGKRDNGVQKVQGMKAFFSTVKSSGDKPKAGPSNLQDFSKIDKSVLAELPEDIRKEILENQSVTETKSPEKIEKKNSQVRPEFAGEKSDNNLDEIIPSSSASLSSQGIDESVLLELPEEIRNEILASKPVIKKKNQEPKVNDYFKNKKPGSFVKPKLQELDMTVLIELPDEIRNEILNEYKKNNTDKVENKEKICRKKLEDKISNNKKQKLDLNNVSFSQVDQDYLAALDKETRADVRFYCVAKKNENQLKIKKIINENLQVQNQLKINKRCRKPKINNNINKTSLLKSKKYEQKRNIHENGNKKILSSQSFLEQSILNDDETEEVDRRDAIKLHQMIIRGNHSQLNDPHQEILTTLVNHLFSLSLQQVKQQIQTWILKSESVNEIDLLSIATYLSMLPKEKRIEDLHVLMKTMHRCMLGTGNCLWHETYRKIIEHVQLHMQIEYNCRLMISSSINCECNSRHL